jgi:hypothetical protein
MATIQQIMADINAHMQQSGVGNNGWYVGIASSPRDRLFVDHRGDEKNGTWIYRTADSASDARAIEDAYHKAGCRGGPGGGDYTTRAVYAYVITSTTAE